jgi:hypothetical protein
MFAHGSYGLPAVVRTLAHYSATPTSAFAYVLPAARSGNENAPPIAVHLSGFYPNMPLLQQINSSLHFGMA